MAIRPQILAFIVFSALWLLGGMSAYAKPIGGEPQLCCPCDTCNQGTSDSPAGKGFCAPHESCSACGCGMSMSKGKAGSGYSVFSATANNGSGLSFSLHYASYNADSEKAVIETVSGYGWSHSYNIYLFKQRSDLFKMSPAGLTTKYKRQGRRGGPLVATRGHQQVVVENPDGSVEIANNDQLTFRFEAIPGNPLRVAGSTPLMLTRITNRNNEVTELTYAGGLLDKVKGPYGREMRFGYNAQNRLIKVIDPAGRETRFSYDAAGNLATITDPLGQVTAYQYNVRHQITRKIDRNGRAWRFAYDANHRPVSIQGTSGNFLFSMTNSSNWATDLNQLLP